LRAFVTSLHVFKRYFDPEFITVFAARVSFLCAADYARAKSI